jgi:hypothetical protein
MGRYARQGVGQDTSPDASNRQKGINKMAQTKFVVNGKEWYYYHARICDELVVDIKAKAWFLLDSGREYIGHFDKKREMLAYIERHSRNE